ncbi:MAG: KpsF/GutQ family sugar-phosphate isomerase [Saprospiraceae bacterium]
MSLEEDKILESGRNCIEVEYQSLLKLKESINDQFVATVKYLKSATGRLIVTGIGKSAIVGQKIVATLNSTGKPAIFMHAADAIHGDIGMIQTGDTVLCISKSGETPEIRVLIPLIKLRPIRLIGMSSNANSYLATQSDFYLHIPIEKEADPNNLAPTASTTAQMAMGDALAVSLLALSGFTPEDFAHFHPGGSLGKMLYLTVKDFAFRHPAGFVHPEDNLQKVVLSISANRLGATAVLDHSANLLGIITDGDIRRLFESSNHFPVNLAGEIMNSSPKTILENESLAAALRIMQEHSIAQLIVLNENKYVGMVHIQDLLKEGIF